MYKGTVLDKDTKKGIPFASISFNKKAGVIADKNGKFSISTKISTPLTISSAGYSPSIIPLNEYGVFTLSKDVKDIEPVLIKGVRKKEIKSPETDWFNNWLLILAAILVLSLIFRRA